MKATFRYNSGRYIRLFRFLYSHLCSIHKNGNHFPRSNTFHHFSFIQFEIFVLDIPTTGIFSLYVFKVRYETKHKKKTFAFHIYIYPPCLQPFTLNIITTECNVFVFTILQTCPLKLYWNYFFMQRRHGENPNLCTHCL